MLTSLPLVYFIFNVKQTKKERKGELPKKRQKKNNKKERKEKGKEKKNMLAGHAFFWGMCACTCARVCAHARMVLVEECAHENGAAVCVENSRLLRHHRWQVWFLKKITSGGIF